MKNAREFLLEWEEKNNPFYPHSCKWTIEKAFRFAKEYDDYVLSVTNATEKSSTNCDETDIRDSLLEEAGILVGHPATNISATVDISCKEWQEKYQRWCNES